MQTFIVPLNHPRLFQLARPAVSGITRIFEDLEWFPEGRPLVDSMEVGSIKKKGCNESSDCQGRPAPYNRALFISFLVEPELSFTCWHSGRKKICLWESFWALPWARNTHFRSQKPNWSTELFLTSTQLHLPLLLWVKGKLTKKKKNTNNNNYIFAHNPVGPAGWSWLSRSFLWPLLHFAITYSCRLIREYEVASVAFVVKMQAPLVPWCYSWAEPIHGPLQVTYCPSQWEVWG